MDPRQRTLALALLASLLLWNLPFGGLLLYPFKLLATWLHELSHGILMLATGAGFDHMEIYRDTSGLAFAEHGVERAGRAAIAAAGYMGTPVVGAALLVLAQSRRGTRGALMGLGLALAFSAALFVRNGFGLAAVSIGAAACFLAAFVAGARATGVIVSFIAAQLCINAVLDIRVLYRANLVVNGEVMGASDAHNMARATFGTPYMWATVWLIWSFVLFYLALRLMFLRVERGRLPTPVTA